MPGGAGLPSMPMLPGGLGWPLPPPAVPPGYAPGSSSEPTAIGPWLNVPMLQYGVLPYLQNGAIIEMSLVDPNGGGMPYATMIVSIQAMPLVNQAGIFLECTFVGCSAPALAPMMSVLLAQPYSGAAIHLCFTPMACAEVAPNGRQHIHSTMIRTRTKTSFSESWTGHGWRAYATDDAPAIDAAAKAKLAAASASLKASAVGAAQGEEVSVGASASGGASAREKEPKKKLVSLKKRLTEQSIPAGGLVARAQKKSKKGDDDGVEGRARHV